MQLPELCRKPGPASDQWRVAKANVSQRDKIRVQRGPEQAVSKRPTVGIENGAARLLQHRLPGGSVPLGCGPNTRVDVGLALRESAVDEPERSDLDSESSGGDVSA